MYSIGQVAEMFGLPISTLRYYDKQGLFPNMERVSGIRKFSEAEIEALRVIECLKKAGMEIKDIRQFMDWCVEGPATYPQRKAMFEERKAHMDSEIAHMNRALDMLRPGDVLALCGKGHEDYQVIDGVTIYLDEHRIVREWLERKGLNKA